MMDTSRNTGGDDLGPLGESDTSRRDRLNRILLRVARGDQAAFAELYRLTSSKLFGVCVRMLRDRGEAEDMLQEVYTTVWRRADTFDPSRASAITWLVTLARNRTIDRLRQHREAQLDDAADPDIVDDQPSPAAIAERSQERRRLERCLEALGEQQRKAVREAFFSGVTYSELAGRASVPLGTMKSWIRRSLMQLKACLER
ncbi:sigma-70 family RNA polymerase sigma factor [Paraburkholderia sp. CNPSo 3157]|uniref:Sigma-70 family RNA polymerase sigma factor n=1 Tax=Paraburkholderia franconis TaxID=2654983 RepID=A0A7X1NH77_9BURK|nr:sigma-70 family RNA polymerase sigma factor [Paraburkholderia franconis]MPW21844.1 sigma-70 family RNA polymerase sigma factor [Paraburkholderia franconis]